MFNQIDERSILKFQNENMLTDNLIKRLELFGTLEGHEGCINSIEWNYSGTKLCSVSDDCYVILWDPFLKKKLTQFHSNHTGNIFAVKFLDFNNENLLVTAAADYKCILHDLVTHEHLMICGCHRQRVKKLATQSHESSLFWSAGEDGLVIQTDIRTNHLCNQDKISNVLIDLKKHCGSHAKITSIACNPVRNEYIAVGSNDQFVRLYDRRMIRTMDITGTYDNLPEDCVNYFTIGNSPSKRKIFHSLVCTNLSFSQTGDELLANISSDNIYLFNILQPKKPKIFSTDLTNVFGPLNDDDDDQREFNIIDDCSSSSDTKRLKTTQCSSSSIAKLSKSAKISKDSLNSNLNDSNALMNNCNYSSSAAASSSSSLLIDNKDSIKTSVIKQERDMPTIFDFDNIPALKKEEPHELLSTFEFDNKNNTKTLIKEKQQQQMPSTSKAKSVADDVFADDEDVEMVESIEHRSKKLIKRINKRQKPNLIKLKAKAKIPKHIAPIYKNAQSLVKKQKYSDAIELINEAIAIMPNVSRFYCLRANAYRERKWNRDLYCALKDFYRSLEIDPNNKESHLKLASVLYDLGYYENAYQALNYFRQKQSKDTRYKEFKELEKKVLDALKQDKPNDDKKLTDVKSKNNVSSYRKFVESFSRSYFSSFAPTTTSSSSNNADSLPDHSTSSSSSSSSSSSPSTSTSSSTANSFLDHFEQTLSDNEDPNVSSSNHQWISDDSDSFQMSQDSSVHEVKRIKSKKELQWRADSYDFEQRFYGHCNVSTDIMEANFFGSYGQYIIGGSDDGNFYIWNRKTTNIVDIVKADDCIVNCVQPHYNSCFIASSGLDSNVKLWAPTLSEELVKEKEKTRKLMIRQKTEDNHKKNNNSSGFGIMFLRVTHLGNDSSDSDDDQGTIRQATLNIRECLPS